MYNLAIIIGILFFYHLPESKAGIVGAGCNWVSLSFSKLVFPKKYNLTPDWQEFLRRHDGELREEFGNNFLQQTENNYLWKVPVDKDREGTPVPFGSVYREFMVAVRPPTPEDVLVSTERITGEQFFLLKVTPSSDSSLARYVFFLPKHSRFHKAWRSRFLSDLEFNVNHPSSKRESTSKGYEKQSLYFDLSDGQVLTLNQYVKDGMVNWVDYVLSTP